MSRYLIVRLTCAGLYGALLAACGVTAPKWQFFVLIVAAVVWAEVQEAASKANMP